MSSIEALTPAMYASGRGGIIPPVEHRWKPGQSGNPSGKPRAAGWTLREYINQFAADDLTEADLRRIARDEKAAWTKRVAAERVIRALEAGDIADFGALLSGECTIEQVRAAGVNTEVVKRVKFKARRVPRGDGQVEEVIESEIELHDRAGREFDRIVNQTAGYPKQHVEADLQQDICEEDFEVRVQKVIDMLEKTRHVESGISE